MLDYIEFAPVTLFVTLAFFFGGGVATGWALKARSMRRLPEAWERRVMR